MDHARSAYGGTPGLVLAASAKRHVAGQVVCLHGVDDRRSCRRATAAS